LRREWIRKKKDQASRGAGPLLIKGIVLLDRPEGPSAMMCVRKNAANVGIKIVPDRVNAHHSGLLSLQDFGFPRYVFNLIAEC
jgi:hypothetical protein